MPLPPALAARVTDERFWTDAYWITTAEWVDDGDRYSDLARCELHFALGDHLLTLGLGGLGYIWLNLSRRGTPSVCIAHDDQAHWHPHLFRWEELDAICAAIAAQDATLPHPGVPLLLLARFAPVTDDDDAARAHALLEAAWDRLGLFTRFQRWRFFDHVDARGAGFVWTTEERGRRHLTQEDRRAGRGLYTLRTPENDEFPFEDFDAMVASARALAGHRTQPLAHSTAPLPLARVRLRIDHRRGVPAEALGFARTMFGRWLREHGNGRAETGWASQDASGRLLETELTLAVRGDPRDALAQLRPLSEQLGVGPALSIDATAARAPAVSLQLVNAEPARWSASLTDEQRRRVSRVLDARSASAPEADGWRSLTLADGTQVRIGFVDLERDPTIDGGCVEASAATIEVAALLLDLAREASLCVVPPILATSETQRRTLDHIWPQIEVVEDAATLLRHLRTA